MRANPTVRFPDGFTPSEEKVSADYFLLVNPPPLPYAFGLMSWFYADKREQPIPATEEDIRQLISRGEILPETLVWSGGMSGWEAASRAKPEWFQSPGPPSGEFQPLSHPSAPVYQMPPGYAAAYGMIPITDGLATASFVCGIVGVFLSLCYGMGVFCSIAAVVMGHISLSNIKKSGDMLQGRGLAVTGLILGYLIIAIIAAVVVFIGIFMATTVSGAVGTSGLP